MDGFQRHFDSQLLAYGKQTILNLVGTWNKLIVWCCVLYVVVIMRAPVCQVNQKGSEKPLEQAFAKMVSGMNNGMLK